MLSYGYSIDYNKFRMQITQKSYILSQYAPFSNFNPRFWWSFHRSVATISQLKCSFLSLSFSTAYRRMFRSTFRCRQSASWWISNIFDSCFVNVSIAQNVLWTIQRMHKFTDFIQEFNVRKCGILEEKFASSSRSWAIWNLAMTALRYYFWPRARASANRLFYYVPVVLILGACLEEWRYRSFSFPIFRCHYVWSIRLVELFFKHFTFYSALHKCIQIIQFLIIGGFYLPNKPRNTHF